MVKKNYKIIIGIVIGIIVSSIGVYAAASLSSSEVTYDNNNSGIKSDNLQGAIDELYKKTNEQKSKMPKPGNSNILKVYFYNQEKESEDFCVTGDEATCKVNTCYLNTSKDSCAPGTIIEYKVKEGEKVRFHVLHDDGETMTLQSQKNTVYSTAWYKTGNEIIDNSNSSYPKCTNCDNSNGPKTILPALEEKTNDWSNVNTLNYSIGDASTTLGASYCYFSGVQCSSARYSLSRNSVKARMVTFQELDKLGCTTLSKSCPIYLHNYLSESKSYDGTENDGNNYAHWTMTTSGDYDRAWYVTSGGALGYNLISLTDKAARAVVEINKNSG